MGASSHPRKPGANGCACANAVSDPMKSTHATLRAPLSCSWLVALALLASAGQEDPLEAIRKARKDLDLLQPGLGLRVETRVRFVATDPQIQTIPSRSG